jgi:MFS family permease
MVLRGGKGVDKVSIVLVVTIFWTGLYLFVPVLSPYASSLGADLSLIGLVVGSYGVTQLILRIPVGWLSDRLETRQPFVIAGFAITALSSLVMYWAPSPWYLVVGRGLSGVAATMWVMLSVMVAAAFPPNQTVAAMGLANFATNLGMVIGTGVGGWVAHDWGWGGPFLVSSGVAMAGMLVAYRRSDKRETVGESISLQSVVQALRSRTLVVISLLGALVQYMMWVTVFGFTPVYAQSLGAAPGDLGWLTAASLVPQALSSLGVGRLTNRFGAYQVLWAALVIMLLTTAAIPFSGSLLLLMIAQVISGVGRGLAVSLLMGLSIQSVDGSRRALVMGIYQSIYAGGMFAGPVIAGALGYAFGIEGLFLSTAGVGLLAIAVMIGERRLL